MKILFSEFEVCQKNIIVFISIFSLGSDLIMFV